MAFAPIDTMHRGEHHAHIPTTPQNAMIAKGGGVGSALKSGLITLITGIAFIALQHYFSLPGGGDGFKSKVSLVMSPYIGESFAAKAAILCCLVFAQLFGLEKFFTKMFGWMGGGQSSTEEECQTGV